MGSVEFIAQAIAEGARRGCSIQGEAQADVELEDVFVDLLEAQGDRA
jgi:hypothetical protein